MKKWVSLDPWDTDWCPTIAIGPGTHVYIFKPRCVPEEYRSPDFEGTVLELNAPGLVGKVGDSRRGQEPKHVLNAEIWVEANSVLVRDHTSSGVVWIKRGGRRFRGKLIQLRRGFALRKDDRVRIGDAEFVVVSHRYGHKWD